MWHENSEEIKVMLRSVFKIDEDYYARRKALDLLPSEDIKKKKFKEIENEKKNHVDFFDWETHIFFDDCMAKPVKGKKDNVWEGHKREVGFQPTKFAENLSKESQ